MVKKVVTLLSAVLATSGLAIAQNQNPCAADQVNAEARRYVPEIAANEAALKREISERLNPTFLNQFQRTTAAGDVEYHVPIVFHVVHDYGSEYVTDEAIYKCVSDMNKMYNKKNADTSDVIAPYKGFIKGTTTPYIGNARIVFHLAKKDPQGNPTTGITRRRSYLTAEGGDQAKYDVWPPNAYMNVWLVNRFGSRNEGAAAYAYNPSSAAAFPFIHYDGAISLASYLNEDNTISHEIAHSLNIAHTFGSTNGDGSTPPNPWFISTCDGNDDVDDTPPTKGHKPSSRCTAPALYDTVCLVYPNNVGRLRIFELPTDTNINYRGIDFIVRSSVSQPIKINSVDFYPTAAVGSSYKIDLRFMGNVIQSYSDVLTVSNQKVTVPLNFTVTRDSGYTLVLSQNPGALADRASEDYNRNITNVITIKSDTAAGLYNFLYNWNISYGAGGASTGVVGKVAPATLPNTNIVNNTLKFYCPTRTIIDSISLYPAGNIGDTFSIGIYRNSTLLATYNDTIKVRYKLQRVLIKHEIHATNDSSIYSLALLRNPGVLQEHFSNYPYPYTNMVKGSISVKEDSLAGDLYSPFYNTRFSHFYFKYSNVPRRNPDGSLMTDADGNVLYEEKLFDYPDTVNAQNVMDYTYCSKMFTHGQTERMRACLESNIANRNNLITEANGIATGIHLDSVGLAPVADFSFTRLSDNKRTDLVFGCADNTNFGFTDRSWRAKIDSRTYTFSNGATPATATTANVSNVKFSEPGWATVKLEATNTAGTGAIEKKVFIADNNTTKGNEFIQEFSDNSENAKWPIFNYFDNSPRWEVNNSVGYYDNASIMYKNFDDREWPDVAALKGTWKGDYDDFYSKALDLSGEEFTEQCNLSFYSSGAFRTANVLDINDSLSVFYSIDCGTTWTRFAVFNRGAIGNKGVVSTAYTPAGMWDWQLNGASIPAAARKSKVFLRFRYTPGVFTTNFSQSIASNAYNMIASGNNFYMDRISVTSAPVKVDDVELDKNGMVIAPNPTGGSANVVIKGGNDVANVVVTDITGKLVYTTKKQLNGNVTTIEIPAHAISVKGVYLVQVVTNIKTYSQKLVAQ